MLCARLKRKIKEQPAQDLKVKYREQETILKYFMNNFANVS